MTALMLIALLGAAPEAPAAAEEPSRHRLICRSKPKLGSRIARQRICKTAEDWRVYEHDLEQSRRDINDRGAAGCDMRYSGEC